MESTQQKGLGEPLGEPLGETLVDRFWREPPSLPKGLRLEPSGLHIEPRRGPGGSDVFTLATLTAGTRQAELLVLFRQRVLASEVPSLAARLDAAIRAVKQREAAPAGEIVPVIATDGALPSVRDACDRTGVGLIDWLGNVLIHTGPLYVHVVSAAPAKSWPRYRVNPFGGKATRVLRVLLRRPEETQTAKEIALFTHLSYVFTYTLLTRLESQGLVTRRSPRSGFRPDGPALLDAWRKAGAPSWARIERFNAPDTTEAVLIAAGQQLGRTRGAHAWALRAAIDAEDAFVGGLPYGLYTVAETRTIVHLLQLRPAPPYNFWLLRPDPSLFEEAGLLFHTRSVAWGDAVSDVQCCVDFAQVTGRGLEQSDFLYQKWVTQLPLLQGDERDAEDEDVP